MLLQNDKETSIEGFGPSLASTVHVLGYFAFGSCARVTGDLLAFYSLDQDIARLLLLYNTISTRLLSASTFSHGKNYQYPNFCPTISSLSLHSLAALPLSKA